MIRRTIKQEIFRYTQEGVKYAKDDKQRAMVCAIKAEALNDLLKKLNKKR